MVGDEITQAGFAQLFLEYLGYKVFPYWKKAESLLSDDVTNRTDESAKKFTKGVYSLLYAMTPK